MQTKLTKISAMILVVTLLCSLFSGCSKKALSPSDTIDALETAINSVDVEALLSCLDSTWAEQLEPILALSVREDGISVEHFLSVVKSVLPVLPFISKGTIQAKDLPKVELTVDQITQNDDDADVSVSGVLRFSGFSKSFSTTLQMRIENDTWVICGVQ